MNPTVENLLQVARGLPADEKIELAEAILASCAEGESLPFDVSWLAEIQRRSQQIQDGTTQTAAWSEVKQRVRQKIQDRNCG